MMLLPRICFSSVDQVFTFIFGQPISVTHTGYLIPMKIRYLLIGMLSSSLALKAQNEDSIFQKKTVSQTDIQLLFSYYSQDGDHSAVTGGIGTQKLTVYAPHLSLENTSKNHSIKADGGVDVITSASTDNIDHVVSSASVRDSRTYLHIGYGHSFIKSLLNAEVKSGFSIESDYFSVPIVLNAKYTEPSQLRSYSITLESYFDDLRWGRLNKKYHAPVELIYPSELRYKEWFDEFKRNTFTIKLAFSQVINKRMVVGIFAGVSYQHGLLATPFHRVYFNTNEERVENLPERRTKIPVGLRLNYFAGSRTILKAEYNFYWDDWGIVANAIQLEAAVKIKSKITFSPFFRVYHQSAASYFEAYGVHDPSEMFYTSDYDLSELTSCKFGAEFRYTPLASLGKKLSFDEIAIRYAAYIQSTDLHAQSVTLVLKTDFQKNKEQDKKLPQ